MAAPFARWLPTLGPRPIGGRPGIRLGMGRGTGRDRPQNLFRTTIARRMARPVELYMKSMVTAAGLGSGAGGGAPCRFRGPPGSRDRIHPLPSAVCRLPSRAPAARARWLATLGPCTLRARTPDRRAARHQATIGTGIERDRALSMMHNAPIACRMASPGVSCIRSVLNTPRLGSGAGGGVLSTIRRDTPGTNSPRAPGPGLSTAAHPTNPLPAAVCRAEPATA